MTTREQLSEFLYENITGLELGSVKDCAKLADALIAAGMVVVELISSTQRRIEHPISFRAHKVVFAECSSPVQDCAWYYTASLSAFAFPFYIFTI